MRNIIYSVIGQIVTILIGLLLPRFILLYFGSDVNGVLNTVNQVFAYFVLLEAGIGLASMQSLYLPIADGDRASVSSIMAATKNYYSRTAKLYAAAIAGFALLFAAFAPHDSVSWLQMVGIIVFSGLGNVVNFWYQGRYKILMQAEGRKYIVSNLQTLGQVLTCAAKLVGIFVGLDIAVVMMLGFIAGLGQTIYYIFYIRRHYAWIDKRAIPDFKAVSKKNSVLVHQLSQLIFQNTDILVLTAVAGFKVVSVYSVYKLVVSAISGVTYQISESLTFALGQKYAKDREGFAEFIDSFDIFYTSVACTLLTVTFVMYPSFINLYTGGVTDITYMDAWLPFLFVVIELLSSFRRAMQNTIDVAGHFPQTVPRSIAETVINLAVSLTLVWRLGMYGVLIGTIAALLYRTNDIIIYANHRILNRSALRSYRIYAICLLPFAAAVVLTRFLPILNGGWWGFIGTALLCLVICAAAYFGICALVFKRQLSPIRGMIAGWRSRGLGRG